MVISGLHIFLRRFLRFAGCVVVSVVLSSCATAPKTGDMIYRPVVETGARHNLYHVVGPAETVFRISRMYDVKPEAVLKANNISNPKDLRVGQDLLIPNAAPLRPVVPLFASKKWKYIVVHHSVTDAADATSLDRMHRSRGFDRGLGYHFVIDNGTKTRNDGQIEASPRWIKQLDGAHCKAAGMNSKGIGICVVGDFTRDQPSRKQMDSLVLLVKTLQTHYHVPASRVIRHKDAPGARTQCPGNSFPWLEFKRRLKAAD